MMTHLPMCTVANPRNQLFKWLRRGLDLLFPPRCVACSQVGSWLCAACQATVEFVPRPICPRCGRPVSTDDLCLRCRRNPLQLDGIRSVALHEGALRQAIHHLKYKRRRELATPLGRMLFVCWQETRLPADVVVPVPLHTSRQKERGYNQASLLARSLAEHADLTLNEAQLVRRRATAPQVGLGAQERKVNVRDAFVWIGDGLADARVLLVDDVCTTGSTLEACALALRQAGAESIWALTLARAHQSSDGMAACD
jgi:ComF family protein